MSRIRITTCNKCGKRFDEWDAQGGFGLYNRIGYGSEYDGCTLVLDLCCRCMDELIKSCAISPIVDDCIMEGGD